MLFLYLTTLACIKKPVEEIDETPLVSESMTTDGLVEQQIDINNDGTGDVFNYYQEREDGAPRLLVVKKVDLNWDGNIDVETAFDEDGNIVKESMDGDFDGRPEWVDHYQGNIRVMTEIDTNYDGKADLFRYYENGIVRRKEQDTDNDGAIDFWQYLDENGIVTKFGRDLDGDGTMDLRED